VACRFSAYIGLTDGTHMLAAVLFGSLKKLYNFSPYSLYQFF
jgi:hypothetical protein